jgi:hypothetical protein
MMSLKGLDVDIDQGHPSEPLQYVAVLAELAIQSLVVEVQKLAEKKLNMSSSKVVENVIAHELNISSVID